MSNLQTPVTGFAPDTLRNLLGAYRGALLDSLTTTGQAPVSEAAIGRTLRTLPVGTAAHFDGTEIKNGRRLVDVEDYDGEIAFAADEDIKFLTLDIQSETVFRGQSIIATGWYTVPTPREVLLAEHLWAFDVTSLSRSPQPAVQTTVAEYLLSALVPDPPTLSAPTGLWVPLEDIPQCDSVEMVSTDDWPNQRVQNPNDDRAGCGYDGTLVIPELPTPAEVMEVSQLIAGQAEEGEV
jgi:hypothetical protein